MRISSLINIRSISDVKISTTTFKGWETMIKNLIYDVGMNNGDDTAYYLYRGFRVIAIEADPKLCEQAASRFRQELENGQLKILNLGIAATPGELDFWICEGQSAWNSFDRKIASRNGLPHHSISVPCQTLDWIIANHGVPHYLKIDIEGNDLICLENLQPGHDLPKYLSVELGQIDHFVKRLQELGYNRFKCISQFNFLPIELPPSREQRQYEFWLHFSNSPKPIPRFLRNRLVHSQCFFIG